MILIALSFVGANLLGASPWPGAMVPVAFRSGQNEIILEAPHGSQLLALDGDRGRVTKQIDLPGNCAGMSASRHGDQLYLTGDFPNGSLLVLQLRTGKIVASLMAGHGATSPISSPDGQFLYVCNRYDNAVGVIDLATMAVVSTIPVVREPVASAITPDGRCLCVANFLPAGASNRDFVAAAISIIDTESKTQTATVALPNGSTSVRGICVSPDGRYCYAVHVFSRYQLATHQLDRGWTNSSCLSVIDLRSNQLIDSFFLDDEALGAANPWAVGCSPDGKFLCVSHAGTHEVSLVDLPALQLRLDSNGAARLAAYMCTLGFREGELTASAYPRATRVPGKRHGRLGKLLGCSG